MHNLERKNIFILGGEGFLGRNIAENLTKDYNCFSIDKQRNIFIEKGEDVFIQSDPYSQKISRGDNDIFVHLIDNKVPFENVIDEEKKLAKNINLKSGDFFIFLSSASVYSESKSEYAKRKEKLEEFYKEYCKKNNIKLVSIRLFNVYGYYQFPNKQGSLIANLIVNSLNNEKTIINDIETKRDFVFAGDVARAIKDIIERDYQGTTDLASGKYTSIRELVELVEKLIGKTLNIYIKNEKEINSYPSPNIDFNKNFIFTDLPEGLKETIKFYNQNIKIITKYERI